jgi:serine/threonine protein kinase
LAAKSIKVLPAAFAQHPERLARFEREAKILASLNHPNIATIYAVEESSDGKALVMELVEGDTLKGPNELETGPIAPGLVDMNQMAVSADGSHFYVPLSVAQPDTGVIHVRMGNGN